MSDELSGGRKRLVVIARKLLSTGHSLLEGRYEMRVGGLNVTRAQLRRLVAGAEAIVPDPTVLVDDELLDWCGEQLKVVANFGVGFDNIDLDACERRGITVTNTPKVLDTATAELAVALTLAATRLMSDAEADLRAGRWGTWDPSAYCGPAITGATVGVVGMGRIGKEYARMMKVFAGEILYSARSNKPEAEQSVGARKVDLTDLLRAADIISIHVPALPSTYHLIDRDALRLVKPTAVLVNTSRGSVVDSKAVAEALRDQRLWGAGLDVFETEPEVPKELLEAPHAVLLPHIGSATLRAREDMATLTAQNVIGVLENDRPVTPVLFGPSR